MVIGHLSHYHVFPTGLWLGMLACVLLAAVAFVAYTAWMNWKLAAEEVSESAAPGLETLTWPSRPSDCSPEMPIAFQQW